MSPIERHVVSRELAEKLKVAGFPQETEYRWFRDGGPATGTWEVYNMDHWTGEANEGFVHGKLIYAAPLATEIMELIAQVAVMHRDDPVGDRYFAAWCPDHPRGFRTRSAADSMAMLWLWLEERK